MRILIASLVCLLMADATVGATQVVLAPEFTGDLATTIITDRTSNPVDLDDFDDPDGTGGWGGPVRASSPLLFRYDDAIDLSAIVDPKDALTLANVKVLFTEYTDEADLTPNLQKTIQINGKVAIDDLPTLPADFSGSDAFDLSDAFLDFRNIDFSPGADFGPFAPVGAVTGHDILASGPIQRVITLHLGSDSFTSRGAASDQSFIVYTQVDEIGDRLTSPMGSCLLDPFDTVVYQNAGTFNGWVVGPVTGNPGGIATNGAQPAATTSAISGFAITPAVAITNGTLIPNSTTALSARTNYNSNNMQQGLLGFQKPAYTVNSIAPLEVEANSLYRIRTVVSSSSAVTNASFYFQFGNVLRTGIASWGFNDPAGKTDGTTLQLPKLPGTPTEVVGYLATKASSGGVGVALSAFIVDTNTTTGQEFLLSSVIIEKASGGRATLGTGIVIKNLGGLVYSPDYVNSPLQVVNTPAPTAWAVGSVNGTNLIDLGPTGGSINAAVPNNLQVTAAQLTAQHGPAPATGDYFDFTNFVLQATDTTTIDTYDTGIITDPDHLYIADIWASTTNPGAASPNLGVFFTHDLTNFSAQNWHTGGTNSSAGTFPALAADPAILLASTPRVYTMAFMPATPNASAKTSGFLFFLWTNSRGDGWPALSSSTIRIHRLLLTDYGTTEYRKTQSPIRGLKCR